MNCPRCSGYMRSDIDYTWGEPVSIYERKCMNCGHREGRREPMPGDTTKEVQHNMGAPIRVRRLADI